jgi:hypothetical protein
MVLVVFKGEEMLLSLKPNYEFKAMEFMSRTVVTSQCVNKILRAPAPSWFVYKRVNAKPIDIKRKKIDCLRFVMCSLLAPHF